MGNKEDPNEYLKVYSMTTRIVENSSKRNTENVRPPIKPKEIKQRETEPSNEGEWLYIIWINDLINNIPEILNYIVYGYVFLSSYYWITFKDNTDFTNFLTKSIATSYILKTTYDIVLEKLNKGFSDDLIKTILYLTVSAILGFIIGKIVIHRWFNTLLYKLHVGRTTNLNIWSDVIKPYTWLRIFMKDGSSYLGQYRYGEPFKSEPIVVLATYQKLDKDTDIVIDHSQDKNDLIMLNTKDFDRIEITYDENYKSKFAKFLEYIKNKRENG